MGLQVCSHDAQWLCTSAALFSSMQRALWRLCHRCGGGLACHASLRAYELNSWHGGAAAQCDHVHSLQHSIPLQRCTGLQQLQPTSLGAPGRPVPARRPAWTCAPSCPARTLMLSFTTPRLACKSALWQRPPRNACSNCAVNSARDGCQEHNTATPCHAAAHGKEQHCQVRARWECCVTS